MLESAAVAGRRVTLRPLAITDFAQWNEVRSRCEEWLVKWEPRRPIGSPDVVNNRSAFAARCRARDRERQLGTAYAFGLFVGPRFCGEINLNGVQRGPFQSAFVGYWVDEACAGQSLVPEGVVAVTRYAFEQLDLHRLQIDIIPRNAPSHRVMDKLRYREEGVAVRYLEINGTWEDHARYAITSEEWRERRAELVKEWLHD